MRIRIVLTQATVLLVTALAAESAVAQPGAGQAKLGLADLIERSEPSCVRLDVTLRDGKAIGSGFIVNDDGWVVTNYHVVAGARQATASFHDGVSAEVEGFLAYAVRRDLAVIKIKTKRKLKALPLADGKPRKGEVAVAIGAPQGLSFTATEGIISAIRDGAELKAFGQDAVGTWLQTSASISPGSSGGPLLNLTGEVMGVNSGGLESAQNLNFAVSAEDIAYVVKVAAKSKLRNLASIEPAPEPRPVPRPTGRQQVVCKLPAERRFAHRFKLGVEEDEFDKVKWLRTEWLPLKHNDARLASCGLRVSVPSRADRPSPGVLWEVGTTARAFAFIGVGARRCQILIDDESIRLSDPEHKGDVGRGGVSEKMGTALRLDGFLKIIMAKKVKARIGMLEYELSDSQLECLRELASRIPLGSTADGEVLVQRYELDEDPTVPESLAKRARAAKERDAAQPGDAPEAQPAQSELEKRAEGRLRLARQFLNLGRKSTARRYLDEIVEKYPGTKAAKEAKKLLEGI